jgi:hypothetical protein
MCNNRKDSLQPFSPLTVYFNGVYIFIYAADQTVLWFFLCPDLWGGVNRTSFFALLHNLGV